MGFPVQVQAAMPSVLSVLREGIAFARAHGLRVRIGEPGIVCVSSEALARWELAPGPGRQVSPLAACVLQQQPVETDLLEAFAAVLGGSLPLRDGVLDGMEKEPTDREGWMKTNAARVYFAGFVAGIRLRMEVRPVPATVAVEKELS